jgi:hypothetical protein
MFIDYECKEGSKHTKLRIGGSILILAAFAVVVVLCCTGNSGVASEIVSQLRFLR